MLKARQCSPRPNRGAGAKRPPRGGGSGAAKSLIWHGGASLLKDSPQRRTFLMQAAPTSAWPLPHRLHRPDPSGNPAPLSIDPMGNRRSGTVERDTPCPRTRTAATARPRNRKKNNPKCWPRPIVAARTAPRLPAKRSNNRDDPSRSDRYISPSAGQKSLQTRHRAG